MLARINKSHMKCLCRISNPISIIWCLIESLSMLIVFVDTTKYEMTWKNIFFFSRRNVIERKERKKTIKNFFCISVVEHNVFFLWGSVSVILCKFWLPSQLILIQNGYFWKEIFGKQLAFEKGEKICFVVTWLWCSFDRKGCFHLSLQICYI